MKSYHTAIMVTTIMVVAILGITNPGFRQPYQLFDDAEGKVIHNYFIFSVYQQYTGFTTSIDGKSVIYKRYIGVALNYFEIPAKKESRQ